MPAKPSALTATLPPLALERKVLLFSGHMIDAPGRHPPRFPAAMAGIATRAIADLLQAIQAGPADLAICSGASGGDLLFDEAVLARGVPLEIFLPFPVHQFIEASVAPAGDNWVARFHKVAAQARLRLMPDERPQAQDEALNPYERVNLWMLEEARAGEADRLEFICLWNGQGGDGAGGTPHMVDAVRRRGGRVHWLDTTRLWEPSP